MRTKAENSYAEFLEALLLVSDAQEVILELTDRRYSYSLNQTYKRFHPSYRDSESFKQSEDWKKREEEILRSLAFRVRRAWIGEKKVVAAGILGSLSNQIVYEAEVPPQLIEYYGISYRVLSTKPEGEVMITEKTQLITKESRKTS